MEQLTKLQEKLKITAFKMKVIAVLSMLIDHYAAVMILSATGIQSLSQSMQVQYSLMRGIGRIAFPIFAFLVVEGFLKTKDRKKYALRMLIFAIISTPAYNIAFGQAFIYTRKFLIAFIFVSLMFLFLSIKVPSKSVASNLIISVPPIFLYKTMENYLKICYNID